MAAILRSAAHAKDALVGLVSALRDAHPDEEGDSAIYSFVRDIERNFSEATRAFDIGCGVGVLVIMVRFGLGVTA